MLIIAHHATVIIVIVVTSGRRQKTETKTRTSPFVRTCQNKLLFAQTGGQTCGLLTEIYSSIDAILKRRD